MVVTIDTNVLFQAFYSQRGASHQIFRMVRYGELTMAISIPAFEEYRDVLSRKENKAKLDLSADDLDAVMLFIATVGIPTDISYLWRPNLRDESDNMMMELALSSGSEYLITQNIRDFTASADLKNDDMRIVTPSEFLKEWRERK